MRSVAVSGQTSRSEPSGNRLFITMAWRILPLLFLGFLASYLDRVNVGYAKLRMLSDLGMSEAAYGLGTGLFFWGTFCAKSPVT